MRNIKGKDGRGGGRGGDRGESQGQGQSQGPSYSSFSGNTASVSECRGFSTSINDMFVDPEFERVDCCAIACCGVLQSDRNRYLISGIKPPSCCRRVLVHFCFPIWIFGFAMFCALNVPDPYLNELLSTGLVFCLLSYFIIQCCKGTFKRREVRKDILWSKHHVLSTGHFRLRNKDDDSVGDDSHDSTSGDFLMGQTKWDIINAHGICGCYARDRTASNTVGNRGKENMCSRLFRCYTSCCCGTVCGMHLQLCGVCGVAQEARELELLYPVGYGHIDYITMQPVMDYYQSIYQARNGGNNSFWWQRLSNLSKLILQVCVGISALLLVWSCLSSVIHHKFGLKNFAVYCATLFQAVLFLAVVHWNHTRDISLDALIKYFASGFCLSTTLGVFFELVVGLTIRLFMSTLMTISGIDVVEQDGYSMTRSGFADLLAMRESGMGAASYRDYLRTFGKDHPIAYTVYILFASFCVAALIEELCKYFGYRMVDHPDFYSQSKLEQIARQRETESGNENEPRTFAEQDRSMESRGASITVAMVATALGFACCENLVYVFIYGGESSFDVQVGVLLVRSLLPVHPIAAALQSIRVCQRDLEKDERIGIGRIVLSGVLFHGFYDFLLMWVDFMYVLNGNYIMDDDEPFTKVDNSDLVSILLSLCVLLCGSWYYLREAMKQRRRLKALDDQVAIDNSRLI